MKPNPCGFQPVFTPRNDGSGLGDWSECPHIKNDYNDMDKESYTCTVCKYSYNLYYEDMK